MYVQLAEQEANARASESLADKFLAHLGSVGISSNSHIEYCVQQHFSSNTEGIHTHMNMKSRI